MLPHSSSVSYFSEAFLRVSGRLEEEEARLFLEPRGTFREYFISKPPQPPSASLYGIPKQLVSLFFKELARGNGETGVEFAN